MTCLYFPQSQSLASWLLSQKGLSLDYSRKERDQINASLTNRIDLNLCFATDEAGLFKRWRKQVIASGNQPQVGSG